jgi:hypothetical protein
MNQVVVICKVYHFVIYLLYMKGAILSIALLLATAQAFQITEDVTLPTDFGWDNVNNTNFLPPVRNQYFP